VTPQIAPMAQAAVSLFGAPLDAGSSGAGSATSSAALPALAASGMAANGILSAPNAASAPFADLLVEAVGQVGELEKQARFAVKGLMTGTGVDVHEAMIATEKSEMGFELMLSVRNKALAAYQQVMGMQF
jgi:flagellar hook-basal body complex protein FliE